MTSRPPSRDHTQTNTHRTHTRAGVPRPVQKRRVDVPRRQNRGRICSLVARGQPRPKSMLPTRMPGLVTSSYILWYIITHTGAHKVLSMWCWQGAVNVPAFAKTDDGLFLCMCVCVCVCSYMCVHVHIQKTTVYIWVYGCTNLCTYVCMCMHTTVLELGETAVGMTFLCLSVCLRACMYVCMRVFLSLSLSPSLYASCL